MHLHCLELTGNFCEQCYCKGASTLLLCCREEEDVDPFLPKAPPPPPPHPLPHFRDKNGWQRYCLGSAPPQPKPAAQQQLQPPTSLECTPQAPEVTSTTSDCTPDFPSTDAKQTASAEQQITVIDACANQDAMPETVDPVSGERPESTHSIQVQTADLSPTEATCMEGVQSATDGTAANLEPSEAAASVGHLPQLAVLASLDQVCLIPAIRLTGVDQLHIIYPYGHMCVLNLSVQ